MISEARSPPNRREARKYSRRQAIIDAARVSFLERGYDGTSMSGLLGTLGGSKATLWTYFRSKEELFTAVIEDLTSTHRQSLLECIEPSADLVNGLTTFCRRLLTRLGSAEGLALWRLVAAESGRNPEIGRIFYERAPKRVEEALAAFMSKHIESGELLDHDASQMACTVVNLCAGRQHHMLLGIVNADPAAIEADVERIMTVFLRAYAAPGSRAL